MIDQGSAKAELQKFMDHDDTQYVGDATNTQAAIDNAINGWSSALFECAKNVVPTSTTASAAKSVFEVAAEGMHLDPTGAVFKAACSSFASALGAGMVGYTASPPPAMYDPVIPPGHPGRSNAEQAADFFSQVLAAWLETGTATHNITGVTIPWS